MVFHVTFMTTGGVVTNLRVQSSMYLEICLRTLVYQIEVQARLLIWTKFFPLHIDDLKNNYKNT